MTRAERQAEAVRLRAEGLSLRAIAERLGCSHVTVQHDLDPEARERARASWRRWYAAKN